MEFAASDKSKGDSSSNEDKVDDTLADLGLSDHKNMNRGGNVNARRKQAPKMMKSVRMFEIDHPSLCFDDDVTVVEDIDEEVGGESGSGSGTGASNTGNGNDNNVGGGQSEPDARMRATAIIDKLQNLQKNSLATDDSWLDYDQDDEQPRHCRCLTRGIHGKRAIAVVFVIAAITVSSAVIGFAIPKNQITTLESAKDHDAPSASASDNGILVQYSGQDLLLIAESLVQKCSQDNLNHANGRLECQTVCHDHLCCFDDYEGAGNNNCRDDANKLCVIYDRCEAIVTDLTMLELELDTVDGDGDEGYDGGDETVTDLQEDTNGEEIVVDANKEDDTMDQVTVDTAVYYVNGENANGGDSEKESERMDIILDGISVGGYDAQADDVGDEADTGTDEVLDDEEMYADGNKVGTIGGDINKGVKVRDEDINSAAAELVAEDWADDINEKTQEELLQVAENIVQSCSEYSIKTETGKTNCEQLCTEHFCCFDDKTGCADDESMTCVIFAGCQGMYLQWSLR